MARRAIWTGSISFGLVNIPVRMFTATQDRSIRFHLLHDQDRARIQRRLVSSATGKEVHPEHIVRGFEIARDQYVVVEKEELETCAPEKTRAIEITDFVELKEIDPVFYERPYYLAPQPGAGKSYRLLVEAMGRSRRVAIARFVMHEKQHLVALRVLGNAICLEVMRYADEIVPLEQIDGIPSDAKIGERELKAAQQLIDSLGSEFDPSRYTDEYRDCIMSIVERKGRGEQIHVQPVSERKPSRAADLMAALEASLAAATRKRNGQAHSHGHGRRRKRA
ncbi:Ku protein [Fontivita pretiosa]|uniref:non-homologous end joining protein Ku n=1 Tax=Fontivita pretiosa TaxID=2989684 RepID=UPI003D17D1DE